ncbi:hypothetical protein L207DRAFT_519558 [Hyaloscypha variabilis F]|jgi:hypothetical protein|uniref:Uncharacterized protein n=1 Tax=Hyaloscypha variabilis (strain UAMH 11265 / GT02V1 / F) TaxID=1149755 RepID=A0A2J6QYG3_HYAVF|nr:hypothetical protein L207DRAFT_519558 [Hyaloscypha variabilis F]
MGSFYFLPNFHSHGLTFNDWLSLLTLCLAPLIAHIVAGVPPPTYLHSRRPTWHDRICHYNPTSILWRYLAITDRRVRAKSWSALEMAATNAIFWSKHGWDGSEEMIQLSQDFCIQPPSNNRNDLLSGSTVVTVIVALQGVQALYSLISGRASFYSEQIAFSTIFYPLAILGLLRLPAALWLTNDFIYVNIDAWNANGGQSMANFEPNLGLRSTSALVAKPTISSLESPVVPYRFHSPRIWQSLAIKAFYLLMLTGLLVMSFVMLVYHSGDTVFTATVFTLGLLFIIYFSITTATVATYVLLGRCNTTIIPCITAKWYKIYTGILFTCTFLVFIFAAIETRKTPCGVYTTYESSQDSELCGPSTYVAIANQQGANATFVGPPQSSYNLTSLDITFPYGIAFGVGKGQVMIAALDGWCSGNELSNVGLSQLTMFERMNTTIILG